MQRYIPALVFGVGLLAMLPVLSLAEWLRERWAFLGDVFVILAIVSLFVIVGLVIESLQAR